MKSPRWRRSRTETESRSTPPWTPAARPLPPPPPPTALLRTSSPLTSPLTPPVRRTFLPRKFSQRQFYLKRNSQGSWYLKFYRRETSQMEGEGVKYTNKKPKKCLKCVLYSWKKNLNNESKFVRSWKDCFCSLISRFNAVKINTKIFSCALFRHTFYAFFAKFFPSELKPFAAFVILHVIHSDHVFYHLMSHNFV